MNKIREVIRQSSDCRLSIRQIAKACNISRPTVTKYLSAFYSTGKKYEEIIQLSDPELEALLNKKTGKNLSDSRYEILSAKFEYFLRELKKTGVTLEVLWKEYREKEPDGYSYSQFCYYYRKWRETLQVNMHIQHKAGDKMFVDFTGDKLKIVDRITGETKDVEVFVGILGASQLTYVEATESQNKRDWIKANEKALLYFEGVPQAIVPDNLKSGVSRANKYEPDINPEYADFASHYGCVIMPARPGNVKDKALVENGVKIVYTRIFAPLRDRIFYSLEELNSAIRELLEKHNNTPFQKLGISRRELFEQTERTALKPLPASLYEMKNFLQVTVQFNYHIELREDRHYYSVPWQYKGKKVKVIYTDAVVEIYHENLRIALHSRDRTKNGYTTVKEHMPKGHAFYADWTPQRMINWAGNIGADVKLMIEKVFECRQYPEQAFKSCLGILSLSKKYGNSRLNKACGRALYFEMYSYKKIKNILERGLDKVEDESISAAELPIHENVRGSKYFIDITK